MRAIKYVGLKPEKLDTVAGSGTIWKNGQTIEVNDIVAAKLLNHPDVWEEVPSKLKPDEVGLAEATIAPRVEDEINHPLVQLDAMTNQQLAEFAQRQFGIEFKQGDNKAVRIEAINNQIGGQKYSTGLNG